MSKPTWPQYLGNASQIASAVVATVGVCLITAQLGQLRRNSEAIKEAEQRAAARQVYMSYSEASIKYPEFAKPDYSKIVLPLEQERYRFFVAHMLFAYDEMLKVFDDPEWRASFEYDLQLHMSYICQLEDTAYFDQYYEKMRGLLKQTRAKCPSPSEPVFRKRK
jgi:hypothetical protein